jgi:hypothetical protein
MQNSSQMGGLGEKFEGFGAAPSDALWGNIAGALDEKKSKKGFFWWWVGSGLAAVLLVSAVIYNSSNNDIQNENPLLTHLETPSLEPEMKSLNSNADYDSRIESLIKSEISISDNYSSTYSNKTDLNSRNTQKNDVNLDKLIDKLNLPINTHPKQILSNNPDEFAHLIPGPQRSLVSLMDKIPNTKTDLISPNLFHPELMNCGDIGERYNRPWELGFRVGYFTDFRNTVAAEYNGSAIVLADLPQETNTYIPGSEVSIPDSYTSNSNFFTPIGYNGSVSKNINVDFTIGKYIGHRLTVNSGINFSRTAYETAYSSYAVSYAKTKITSLAIPIGIGFDFIKRKRYKMRLGVALNNEFSAYENSNSVYVSGPPTSRNGFTTGYSASTDFSINNLFQLRKGLYLSVAPTYRMFLTQNIKAENLLIEKNHWVGGTLGLIWSL